MPYTAPVLAVDKTGKAANNYIIGELQSPPLARQRLLIPIYGSFFAEDFAMVDDETDAEVDPSLYAFSDLDTLATEESGKAVYSCLLLEQAAPAGVRISYHAYGGPGSRNASFLVNWLAERSQLHGRTIEWADVKNKPQRFKPADHKHLLGHIYGTEYINECLARLERAIAVGNESMWMEYSFQVDRKLAQYAERSNTIANVLAREYFEKAKKEFTLFSIGLDLVQNYPLLGEQGAMVAPGEFSMDTMDERFVDLKGLGSFSKAMAKRLVSSDKTNLGLEYGKYWEASRGSFVGARVGSVFILPARKTLYSSTISSVDIYPKNFPDTDEFVVEKIAAGAADLSAVFMGFNGTTGEYYTGVLVNENCSTPLRWYKGLLKADNDALLKLVDDHESTNNNPHDDHKDKFGYEMVENLPVVSQDDIVTGTGVRKLVTVDSLLYHILTQMEGVKLERDENGEVDYTKNTMNDAKIVFAPCDGTITKDGKPAFPGDIPAGQYTGPTFPPKGQFIKSFCDGSDKYTRWTDGAGSFYDELTDKSSDDCNFKDVPRQGELLSEYCQNQSRYKRYADGKGGSYSEITRINDPECGYLTPDAEGKVLAEYCRDKDQYTRYANGKGGVYELLTAVNTYKCGGEIYNLSSLGGSTETGGSSSANKPKIKFATTHTKIYADTTEILSFYASGMIPEQEYKVDWWVKSTALNDNVATVTLTTSFTATSKGDYIYERTQYDNGTSTPRGVYDSWVEIALVDIASNHVTREFMSGAAPDGNTDPNSSTGGTNAGGTPAGSGNSDSNTTPSETPGVPIDVSGNPMTGSWPPPPLYAPEIQVSSTHAVIRIGDDETLRVTMSGFYAVKTYTLNLYASSAAMDGGTPTLMYGEPVKTNGSGYFRLELALYDSGKTPRGTYSTWATVDSVQSNRLDRIFSSETKPTGYEYNPKVQFSVSRNTVAVNDTYSHTVVITGMEKNMEYTLICKGRIFDSFMSLEVDQFWSVLIRTDDNGYYRYDRTMVDDGTSPRKSYEMWVSCWAGGNSSFRSGYCYQDFTNNPTDAPAGSGTGFAMISYTSDVTGAVPWDSDETQTITVTKGIVGADIRLQFWAKMPNYNGGQPTNMEEKVVRVDSVGRATASVVTRDTGAVPRGSYDCWAVCPEYSLTSSSVIRKFAPNTAATPAPTSGPVTDPLANAFIGYSSDSPTIYPGTVETHSFTLSGAQPNTTYTLELWYRSAVAGNNQPTLAATYPVVPTLTTNSAGSGSASYTAKDNGIAPRGLYTTWAQIQGSSKQSSPMSRTLADPPLSPSPVYTPTLTFSTSHPTITPNTAETLSWSMTKAEPNKTVTVEYYYQSSVSGGGVPVKTVTQTGIVKANGTLSNSYTATDTNTMPRGTYTTWVYCPDYALKSREVQRVFAPTPAPTEPPYNPKIDFSTSTSILRAGTTETFYLTISGMRTNTTYTVGIYAQMATFNGGAATLMTTRTVTTTSLGIGYSEWTGYDNGDPALRGSWSTWAAISGVKSSNPFTRTFV